MAFSVNQVVLVGNISQDPELTYTPKGNALLKFSLATNHSVRNDSSGEWDDIPSFHRIVVWGKMAEFLAGETQKGDRVYVDGRIQYGSYEGSDGVKRYTTDIIAKNIIPMKTRNGESINKNDTKSKSKPKSTKKTTKSDQNNSQEVNVDDIPF